jgi:alanyl-tRNA synthetase
MEKAQLIAQFRKDYKKYWEVELFRQSGWIRKTCTSCGKTFWTLDPDRQLCGDVPCVLYSFIGRPPTKKSLNYIESWKAIERYFVKAGHTSIPSYPVVCRWFPGLYFTIASIVAFQRAGNGTLFELPANPLIIPQACMRFNDIPNVGRTGRHFTNFVMVGQHSLWTGKDGYWKDRCVELDFGLLTKVFGIRPEDITWIEDVWLGPSAFGYSLEYMVAGLELGNAVFTEFLGTPQKWKKMAIPVIDMGAGLERFAWISQGSPTAYQAVFGPALDIAMKGIEYDKSLFLRYSKLAGWLNLDEVADIEAAKRDIAEKLGTDFESIERQIGQLEAAFAITDHIKSILFGAKDGCLPSNVGGGYNLRVILRRAFDLAKKWQLDIDFFKIAEAHAKWLKPLFPDICQGLESLTEILSLEQKRYTETKARGQAIIAKLIAKGEELTTQKLVQLYESYGIQPQTIVEQASKHGLKVTIPENFWTVLSERHMTEICEEKEYIDVTGLKATKPLFYSPLKKFGAKVVKVGDKFVILDRTAFYPESGGQEADHGWLCLGHKKWKVYDVKKFGNVIVHYVENHKLKPGQNVKGIIDWQRREQLKKHHTAIHIINGLAREIFGSHIWQAGSGKSVEKAHLDITHYKAIEPEEIIKLQKRANEIVRANLPVTKQLLPRPEAEAKYSMRIYQGGAVPQAKLRIVSIKGLDTEACGGLHVDSTAQIGQIVILGAERIQDGIDRIVIKAGPAAQQYIKKMAKLANAIISKIGIKLKLTQQLALMQLTKAANQFHISVTDLPVTIDKFLTDIEKNNKKIAKLAKQIGQPIPKYSIKGKDIPEICQSIFNIWKEQGKTIERMVEQIAKRTKDNLLKMVRDNKLIAKIDGERKEMIAIAGQILKENPKITVIFFNKNGEIIGMSKTENMGEKIAKLCKSAGGAGGGKQQLGQGKADPKKLADLLNF